MSGVVNNKLISGSGSAFIDRRKMGAEENLRRQVCNPNWFIDTETSRHTQEKIQKSLRNSADQTFIICNDGILYNHFVCYVKLSGAVKSIPFQIFGEKINFDLSKMRMENSLLYPNIIQDKTDQTAERALADLRRQICDPKWFFPKKIPVIEHVRDMKSTVQKVEIEGSYGNRKEGTFTVQPADEHSYTVIVSGVDSVYSKTIALASGKIYLDRYPYSSFDEIRRELNLIHPHVMLYQDYVLQSVEDPAWFVKDECDSQDHQTRLKAIPYWFYVQEVDFNVYEIIFVENNEAVSILFSVTQDGIVEGEDVYLTFAHFLKSLDLSSDDCKMHPCKSDVENPMWYLELQESEGIHLQNLVKHSHYFYVQPSNEGGYQLVCRDQSQKIETLPFRIQGGQIICFEKSYKNFYRFLAEHRLSIDVHLEAKRTFTQMDIG